MAGIGAQLLFLVTAFVTASVMIGSALEAYESARRQMAPSWSHGAVLVAVVFLVAALLGALAINRARPKASEQWLPVAIAVSGCGIAAAAMSQQFAWSPGVAATVALLSIFVLGNCLIASGVSTEHRERYALGFIALIGFGLCATVFVGGSTNFAMTVACLMAMSAIWAGMGWMIRTHGKGRDLAIGPEAIAWLILGGTAFVASFHGLWSLGSEAVANLHSWTAAASLVGVLYAVVVTIGTTALFGAKPQLSRVGVAGGLIACGIAIVLAAIASLASMPYGIPTGLAILGSLGFGSCLVAAGLAMERRPLYWLGSAYLVVSVLIRFFEYETSQLTKSLAFLATGAAVLIAGAYFERRHKNREAMHVR
ncbi:MAG: hypothetical protein ACHQ50_00155 [Fimbriimonadales bacterium]